MKNKLPKVFISYSQKDRDFVSRLAQDLQSYKIDVWVDYLNLQAGASFATEIDKAIRDADYIAPVLSPNYVQSNWAEAELNLGLLRETEEHTTIVLPILIRDCEIPRFLRTKVYADFRTDYQKGLTSLVKSITPVGVDFAVAVDFGTSSTGVLIGSDVKETIIITGEKTTDELADLKTMLKEAVELFRKNTGPRIEEKESSIFGKTMQKTQDNLCFIIMPFGSPDLNVVYEYFVKPIVESEGFECVRGDDIFGSNVIIDDIWKSINKAQIIIAELTGRNANVFYEVGISHAIGKNVLLLAQSIDDVPFDLRHRRVLLYEYSPRGCKKLEDDLKMHIKQINSDV